MHTYGHPVDLDALFELSWLLDETSDLEGAIGCYERILEYEPDNENALRAIARSYFNEGLEGKAASFIERISYDPDGFLNKVVAPVQYVAKEGICRPVFGNHLKLAELLYLAAILLGLLAIMHVVQPELQGLFELL